MPVMTRRAAGAPAGAERGAGVPASDGDGGSGGAKPPGQEVDVRGRRAKAQVVPMPF